MLPCYSEDFFSALGGGLKEGLTDSKDGKRGVAHSERNETIRRIHGELDKGYLQSIIIQGTTLRSSSSRTLKTNSRNTE